MSECSFAKGTNTVVNWRIRGNSPIWSSHERNELFTRSSIRLYIKQSYYNFNVTCFFNLLNKLPAVDVCVVGAGCAACESVAFSSAVTVVELSELVNAARIPLANDFLAFNTGWNLTSFTKGLSRS